MTVNRGASRRLLATAIALAALAALLSVQPASALTCANEWGGETFASAQQAVAQPGRWDALVVGTIAAVARKDDYWRTRVLVVEPGVTFSGDIQETVRVAIGGHGPEMNFAQGAIYFLSLSFDPAMTGWFVHPCGPNMELTGADQLAQLRATSDTEIVILEPDITGTPAVIWVSVAVAVVAFGGVWLMRRTRPSAAVRVGG